MGKGESDPHGDRRCFCERCGARLEQRPVEHTMRPVCPACGFVAYLDPKVAAGVVVTLDGRVVLLRRAIEPSIGKWVFPGGYVDRGEPTPAAAVRETREEVGLDVMVEDLLGVYSYEGVPVVLVVYTARVVGGELRGNTECQEVRTFASAEIPWEDLGFQSTADALRTWAVRRDMHSGK
ncbi:MAG: NUDIX hydrolase [Candidatus Latescibacteria bacterium]|jgi:mutator protein MutT|nr:NUDIX hydrolase [Candidatus Latescibacterota bacterium]